MTSSPYKALIYLGYSPDRDFLVSDDGPLGYSFAWYSTQPRPDDAVIEAAILHGEKQFRIGQINTECRSRLLARYGPAEEQVSRAIGVYGAQEQSGMQAGIAATIDASNTASNAVLAVTDATAAGIAAVEAVTVAWPVI